MPDHVTAKKATDWIARQSDHPWALYVNFQSTHFSYRIPPTETPRFGPTETAGEVTYFNYDAADRDVVRNRYDSALAYVDAQIGRLARFLEERGQLEDTLWVVTADHGESFLDHGLVTHGRSLFDTEARVPLLFHYPARLPPRDVTTPVSQLDLLPTILDAIGLPEAPVHQGRSLLPLLEMDEAGEQPRAIFMNIQGLRSMRGVVCWPYKFIIDEESETERLFDLAVDPKESQDLKAIHPEVSSELRRLIRGFIAAQRDYHKPKSDDRKRYYAPRIPSCPALQPGR